MINKVDMLSDIQEVLVDEALKAPARDSLVRMLENCR